MPENDCTDPRGDVTQDNPLDRADLKARVDKALGEFLAVALAPLHRIGEELAPVADVAADFLMDGGKRLRPAFCYWGWRGAGRPDTDEAVRAAASLELLQACALVHDDVMDRSDTRRGKPSVHRRFASLHRGEGWHGDPDAFGESAAILVGDLCLVWADQLLATSGMPIEALHRAKPMYDEMRVELMSGQYLDVLEQALGGGSVERALRVARFKAAKYTIERPLHLGASLAGGTSELIRAYSAYGLPLGEAFQLRDDVLGVYGDPAETGKPAGDDLREGKRTALVAFALDAATEPQAATLRRHLGDSRLDESGVATLRDVIRATGALDRVEQLIAARTAEALAALSAAPVEAEAADALRDLAVAATSRRG
jgi:geranylgeranyl diphosphate synthase type I